MAPPGHSLLVPERDGLARLIITSGAAVAGPKKHASGLPAQKASRCRLWRSLPALRRPSAGRTKSRSARRGLAEPGGRQLLNWRRRMRRRDPARTRRRGGSSLRARGRISGRDRPVMLGGLAERGNGGGLNSAVRASTVAFGVALTWASVMIKREVIPSISLTGRTFRSLKYFSASSLRVGLQRIGGVT